jgi:hypothetical protein
MVTGTTLIAEDEEEIKRCVVFSRLIGLIVGYWLY